MSIPYFDSGLLQPVPVSFQFIFLNTLKGYIYFLLFCLFLQNEAQFVLNESLELTNETIGMCIA